MSWSGETSSTISKSRPSAILQEGAQIVVSIGRAQRKLQANLDELTTTLKRTVTPSSRSICNEKRYGK